MNNLIVLSGEAGSGKDSAAKILVGEYDYQQMSLADGMKKFAQSIFGWTDEQLWGPSKFRNDPDHNWAQKCSACDDPRYQKIPVCLACKGTGILNINSPRRVLQLLGDEWGRQMIHPDIWSKSISPLLRETLSKGTKVVINDARFNNDRENLANWFGAKLVLIERERATPKTDEWREHASEKNQPKENQVHYVLYNNEEWPFPSLKRKIDTMLRSLYKV